MVLLLLYSCLMSVGQIGFKYLARSMDQSVSLASAIVHLPFKFWFWALGLLYFLSTLYWIWLLASIPVSIAYPFVSLALVIIPILSWYLFSETLSLQYWLGVAFIMSGVLLVVR
jgi:drug/metabolite transporter (DMT)-like permease